MKARHRYRPNFRMMFGIALLRKFVVFSGMHSRRNRPAVLILISRSVRWLIPYQPPATQVRVNLTGTSRPLTFTMYVFPISTSFFFIASTPHGQSTNTNTGDSLAGNLRVKVRRFVRVFCCYPFCYPFGCFVRSTVTTSYTSGRWMSTLILVNVYST